jgi:hypothetical protein
VAILTEDICLGIRAALPLIVSSFQREMGVIMINLVARCAHLCFELETGLLAGVKTAAALF